MPRRSRNATQPRRLRAVAAGDEAPPIPLDRVQDGLELASIEDPVVAQQVAIRTLAERVDHGPGRGVAALREAVRREDALRDSEPADWIQPVRHALGAALLQAGRAAEAEAVYRDDLARLPGNGWSLFGLAHSLRLQGRHEEAERVRARFESSWEGADVAITSSCFCQPET